MDHSQTLNRLTVTFLIATGMSIGVLSTRTEGALPGVAAWVLLASLGALLMLCSFRARTYVSDLMAPGRLETEAFILAQADAVASVENRSRVRELRRVRPFC